MRIHSDANNRRRHKLLAGAQLMALAFFVLGLAFTLYPTAGTLFLFAALSPVLVPGAVLILATQWIAAYQDRQGAEESCREGPIRQQFGGIRLSGSG